MPTRRRQDNDFHAEIEAHIRLEAGDYRLCDDGSEFGTRVFREGRTIEVPSGNRRGEKLRDRIAELRRAPDTTPRLPRSFWLR